MTTYVYETVPQRPEEKPQHFEFAQNMTDPPLTKHPETGVPVRRVIIGGYGVLKKDAGASSNPGQCGPGCGCHN
jgi:predicted nucleic acid-binding Zn ribbon protein